MATFTSKPYKEKQLVSNPTYRYLMITHNASFSIYTQFSLQQDETVKQPVPGGRVCVKTKPCSIQNKTRYYMKDHQHTHTNMVRHLADYEDMRKNRMIRHMIQDDERKEWLQEQDKKYKNTRKQSMMT